VQIGRGPATVIGEPDLCQARRPATVPKRRNGKAEDPAITRSQEACPGTYLLSPTLRRKEVWGAREPSKPELTNSEPGAVFSEGFFIQPA